MRTKCSVLIFLTVSLSAILSLSVSNGILSMAELKISGAWTMVDMNSFAEEWITLPKDDPTAKPRSLHDNVQPSNRSSPSCRCLHCGVDQDCGGLWTGGLPEGAPRQQDRVQAAFDKISLVVSHCLHDLDWLANFTKGFHISNITIYSKCDKPVHGAPPNSHIVRLPNVGRCDHSYAHHMAHVDSDSKNEAIIFIKDNREEWNLRQPGTYRSLDTMIRILQRRNFACGIHPRWKLFKDEHGNLMHGKILMSVYHATDVLSQFSMAHYKSVNEDYQSFKRAEIEFSSGYSNFGAFMKALGYSLPSTLTEVCYGGTFGVTRTAIRRQPQRIWKALEKSLSRGNNIEEGHFVERSWAGLLSEPLLDYQIQALQDCSTDILQSAASVYGALAIPQRKKKDKLLCLVGKQTLANNTRIPVDWNKVAAS